MHVDVFAILFIFNSSVSLIQIDAKCAKMIFGAQEHICTGDAYVHHTCRVKLICGKQRLGSKMLTVAKKPALICKDWGPGPFVKIITNKQVAVSVFVRFRNANVSISAMATQRMTSFKRFMNMIRHGTQDL